MFLLRITQSFSRVAGRGMENLWEEVCVRKCWVHARVTSKCLGLRGGLRLRQRGLRPHPVL